MVKRAHRLSPDTKHGYHHPISGRLKRKKYAWRCEVCGRVWIYKGQAEECEIGHLLDWERGILNPEDPEDRKIIENLKRVFHLAQLEPVHPTGGYGGETHA